MNLKIRLLRLWRQVMPLIVLIALLTSFRSAIADWNDVPTGSMKPTILEGDRIFVNKLAYGLKVPFTTWHLARWDVPQRGEVVVFNSPRDGTRLVKRVVGLPGDVVEMRNNQLIINGSEASYEPLPEPIAGWLSPAERSRHRFAQERIEAQPHPVMSDPQIMALRDMPPVVVPADHYFMLGDNRDNSADSRYVGMVPLDQIVGRSSRVAFSLNYDNYYLPRWTRFFEPLP